LKLPAYQALSKEQDKINNLPLNESFLVTGPPGTGKTVMALYRTKMLEKEKTKVSLLMHSRLLSQYTSDAVGSLGLNGAVQTFHSWFNTFYQTEYRCKIPSFGRYEYDWTAILKQLGQNPPKHTSLEYLIVDEGQDIHKNFYPIARHLSRCITVFADENQRLTETNSTIPDIKGFGNFRSTHELRKNYRNTREIADLAAHFYTGLRTGIPDPPDRRGEKPIMTHHKQLHDTAEFIARYERNNPKQQIGVFVPYARTRDSLFNRLAVDGRTKNAPQKYVGGQGKDAVVVDFKRPGITVLCYPSAKGLEFDTVFLPELQDVKDDIHSAEFKMKFYVLISRARESLYLSYSGDEEPKILEAFPKSLVDSR
jgi:DNA helicase IV